MGKGSDKKSTTTTTLPDWAKPLAVGAGNQIINTVQGNQGMLDSLSGQIRGYLPQLGQMAFGPNAGLGAATSYATDVVGGKYLDGNPYLEGMINQTRNNTSNAINSTFAGAGRTGGGNHVQRAAEGMANAENSMRFQNYASERGNQQQAAGMMPSLTQAQYAGVMPYLAATTGAGQLPFYGIQNLGQVGGLYGGSGSSTTKESGGGGLLGGILGGILGL